MTTEYRIKEIERNSKAYQGHSFDSPVANALKDSLTIIKELQEEVNKWKAIHQADVDQSNEIIIELKRDNEALRETLKALGGESKKFYDQIRND